MNTTTDHLVGHDVPVVVPPSTPAAQGAHDESTEPITQTLRVLHLINGEHYSGAERVQDLLALRLPEFGFDVGFACVKPDRFPKMRKAQQSPLYPAPMRSKFDLRGVGRLVRLMRGGGYHLLHAHTPRTLLIGRLAASLARVPLVYHVHSPAAHDSTRRLHNRANALLERIALAGSTPMIAVSESLGRHMRQRGFRGDRVTVVPNGVPEPTSRRNDRPPRGTWTLGTVALFRPRKGTELLLDALAILRDEGRKINLRAVGPFETAGYERQLKQQATRLGLQSSVEWIGFTREVDRQLAQLDLFVLPSLFGEGLPMVVLEAMAAGVPVVGTDVAGTPEAVREGIEGAIAAPRSPCDLAAAIARVVDGHYDWTQLHAASLARHAEHFSDRAMAEGVAQVYRNALR